MPSTYDPAKVRIRWCRPDGSEIEITPMPSPADTRPKPETENPCPSCEGEGWLDSLDARCPRCGGSGSRDERLDALPLRERRG